MAQLNELQRKWVDEFLAKTSRVVAIPPTIVQAAKQVLPTAAPMVDVLFEHGRNLQIGDDEVFGTGLGQRHHETPKTGGTGGTGGGTGGTGGGAGGGTGGGSDSGKSKVNPLSEKLGPPKHLPHSPPAAPGPTYGNLPLDSPERGAESRIVQLVEENGKWRDRPIGVPREVRTAKGQYIFVVVNGQIRASKAQNIGHTELARGGRVTWAGTITFTQSGALKNWNNASGHYLPSGTASQVPNNPPPHPSLTWDKFVWAHRGPVTRPDGRKQGPQLPVFQEQTKPRPPSSGSEGNTPTGSGGGSTPPTTSGKPTSAGGGGTSSTPAAPKTSGTTNPSSHSASATPKTSTAAPQTPSTSPKPSPTSPQTSPAAPKVTAGGNTSGPSDGTAPKTPPKAPDLPKTGMASNGRVTVNYDFSGDNKSVKVKNINLSDYPPDKPGKITGFFTDRPLLSGLAKAGTNFGASHVSDKMLEEIKSHYAGAVDKAEKVFLQTYPIPKELEDEADLGEHKETYRQVMEYVSQAGNAIRIAGKPDDRLLINLEGAFAYENALIDLDTKVEQLAAALPELAADIDARSRVLSDIGYNFEEVFKWIHSNIVGAIPIVYYQSFTFWQLRGVFKSLGARVGNFSGTIKTRHNDYKELIDKLNDTLVRIGADLDSWREMYDTRKH